MEGLIISNEPFIDEITWLDYLKLKFSYDELGNIRSIGFSPFGFLILVTTNWMILG